MSLCYFLLLMILWAGAKALKGGSEASDYQKQIVAFVECREALNKVNGCLGTVVSSNWILTAHHCTQGCVSMEVVVGHRTPFERTLQVDLQKTVRYPLYSDDNWLATDIALLRTTQPISSNVQKAAIFRDRFQGQKTFTVIGRKSGGTRFEIDQAQISAASQKDCKSYATAKKCNAGTKLNGNLVGTYNPFDTFCSSSEQTHMEPGDSGGPILMDGKLIGLCLGGTVPCDSTRRKHSPVRYSFFLKLKRKLHWLEPYVGST